MFLEFCTIFIISAIEGLTEFLPVSSTSHILLLSYFLDFKIGNEYLIGIQCGAMFAVFFLYRQRMQVLFHEVISLKPKLITTLSIITVPSLMMGLILHKMNFLNNISLKIMVINLIIGGILMLIFRKYSGRNDNILNISLKSAFIISIFQIVAFYPGVSRSASVIFGGMYIGLSRRAAIEISFLSGLPVIFCASVFEIYTEYTNNTHMQSFSSLLIGMFVAFIFACIGIIVLKKLVKIGKDFEIFGVYRILMGVVLFFII